MKDFFTILCFSLQKNLLIGYQKNHKIDNKNSIKITFIKKIRPLKGQKTINQTIFLM